MLCPHRSRSGTPCRFGPRAAPAAAPPQGLLSLEQLQPGRKPLFTCSDLVVGHCFLPTCGYNGLAWPPPPMASAIVGVTASSRRGQPSEVLCAVARRISVHAEVALCPSPCL